ncbi:hypothetical protein POTOM_004857 [Populus tomentosa]|uniref:Uncharacterized protein n=1 Tax=Populus tomentosa TaxID=118781 RepID=A0A8X8DDQ9_POPTO|nr:hypothetical protein POTOM_004857 [Populus tomentosa]
MQALKHSLLTLRQLATPPISSSPAPAPQCGKYLLVIIVVIMQATHQPPGSRPRVYQVTSYGADPTRKSDSTET